MKKLSTIVAATLMATACTTMNDNPLLKTPFQTEYNVPPFEEIKPSHYVPAFEAAIDDARRAIDLIASNRADATFQNTIIPFDRRDEHLNVISNILFNICETDVTDTLNIVSATVREMLTSYGDETVMNDALFMRVKKVYDDRFNSGLDSSQIRVAELYYKQFVRGGALLSPADKDKLKEINLELAKLSHKFAMNLLAETNAYQLVIDTVPDLAGLPEGVIAAAAERAEKAGKSGKWLFTLQKASMIPFLTYSEKHDLRKQIYDAYSKRGNNDNENDNKDIIIKLSHLRAQKAELLGYKSHAHYVISENMASTPEAVDSFLMELWTPALQKAKYELKDMKDFAWRYNHTTTLEACDWFYWAEKLRKAKFDVDETELSQYFALPNVRAGLFEVANKLYGIKFKKLDNVPVYNKECSEVFEVTEKDGSYLGVFYFDYFPRASKGAGAWCTSFQSALDNFDGTREAAQVSNVCNFTAPVGDQPALLTYDDVETMFHEFGHGLHALFSKGYYRKTCGEVPRDYVELPSQIMEHWPNEPECLKTFAKHFQTGEAIPDALIEKVKKAGTFNQGFATVEYLAASLLDLKWHTIDSKTVISDANAFEAEAMKGIGLIDEILPRYRSTYLAHCFSGGYSAGYYVYMWAELLDCDAFAAYKESGDIYNTELAASFRKNCLAEVGEDDAMNQYLKFRGKKPDVKYLIEKRGLNEKRPVYVAPKPVVAVPVPAPEVPAQ
ncbi:MAG: M3 family metallopeptidase [Bacteroidales bacterium]|nr:M3 family metallopeptidase [Bacteroidales bacterium]